jgi:hypothetical protein
VFIEEFSSESVTTQCEDVQRMKRTASDTTETGGGAGGRGLLQTLLKQEEEDSFRHY